MKFAFVDTYYPAFIDDYRSHSTELEHFSYERQLNYILDQSFGTSNFYSKNIIRLGYEAKDYIVNDEILQFQWVKENNMVNKIKKSGKIIQRIPLLSCVFGNAKWVQEIALAQLERDKPNITYLQDLSILNPETLTKIKKISRLLVGQIASPLPSNEYLRCFDLIITSMPHFISKIRALGIPCEYLKIGFEKSVVDKIRKQKKRYDVTFIGSFSYYHRKGIKILEEAAKNIPINIWGFGLKLFDPFSPIRNNYHGHVWGLEMYKILAQSKIVINRHIDMAKCYANNMRLYETTGMGTFLITDYKKNLNELFEIGKEIVAYKNSDDLVRKIKYYLTHEDERERIALAGQKRTLTNHTYLKRMRELINIINNIYE